MRSRRQFLLTAAILSLCLTPVSAADIDIFIGEYVGRYYSPDGDGDRNRDLGVKIGRIDSGFNLEWVTTTFKEGKPKEKTYSIDFLETDRQHIYQAAQKKNLFGGRSPLDPMKGEPFAWARIIDRTMSVFVLLITDEGDWEMLSYERVLTTEGNLDVQFSRYSEGELVNRIVASLERKQ